jgi:replicative DNA helicase
MSKVNKIAKELIKAGLSIIPLNENKKSTIPWKQYQGVIMLEGEVDNIFTGANSIGIICGKISSLLEVIDVDSKYDLTGNLWNEFSNMLKDNLLGTYEKLLIAETKNKGYHIYYKAENIEGNITLAERKTTPEEREEKPEKTKTIIETRGEGGYIVAPPTPGYNYIQGNVLEIPTITPEERNLIISIARSFNEIQEEKELIKYNTSVNKVNKIEGLSPFDDFNKRGEVIPLLENQNYTIVKETADRIYLKRPGNTDSETSGNYLKSSRLLYFHSSNAYPFEKGKGYNPSQTFALLECNETYLTGYKETYRKLLSLGYGDAITSNKSLQVKTTNIQVSKVNRINNVNTEISQPGDTLKIDTLKNVYGDEFIINLLQVEEQEKQKEETIKAIELIKKESEIIFVTINGERLFYPWYIFGTYTEAFVKLYDTDKDRAIITLKRDVIGLLSTLKPTDKDIIKNEFLSMEVINVLGITSESLELEVEAIKKEKTEEKKLEKTKEVIDKADELIEQGKTKEALKFLEEGINKINGVDNENSFEEVLNVPTDENSIRERASNTPNSIGSGIVIDKEEFLLQAGGLNYLGAYTSHGKTTGLINIAINVLERYKNSEIFYLSYEEDKDALTYSFLNTFIKEELSSNNRRSIEHYFKTGSMDMILSHKRETFRNKKEEFFNTLINSKRLNINRIHYDYTELIEFIKHIKRTRNPKAIFIDYVQIINNPPETKNYSRQGEVKDIGLALNKLAQETGLPIILGAQFNRTLLHALDLDYTKLAEAGDIERQADTILGIWNNKFKGRVDSKETTKLFEDSDNKMSLNLRGTDTWYLKVLKKRKGRVNIDEVIDYLPNEGVIKNRPEDLKFLQIEEDIQGELF